MQREVETWEPLPEKQGAEIETAYQISPWRPTSRQPFWEAMSTFTCEHCGTTCYDVSGIGYVTGCEHHPVECYCKKMIIGQCVFCAITDRMKGGDTIQDIEYDYGHSRKWPREKPKQKNYTNMYLRHTKDIWGSEIVVGVLTARLKICTYCVLLALSCG